MNQSRLARVGVVALFVAIVGSLAGIAVPLLGLAPIKASSGHWQLTRWFLQTVKERSVATQAPDAPGPNLDDPDLILLGAGHYELGCRPCHGAPGRPPPVVPSHALPSPPDLNEVASRYTPEELLFIIHNGIKFTGMPAWPASERRDEIWPVVALVKAFPRLDAQGYDALVYDVGAGEGVTPPHVVSEVCARCHGIWGLGRAGDRVPKLAAQKSAYLRASLDAYASGERPSGIMQPVASQLSERQRQVAVEWYASAPATRSPSDETLQSQGQAIAQHGVPRRKVPSCADCHNAESNAAYPLLDGQTRDYLRQQLHLFIEGKRGGSPYAKLMNEVAAHALTEREVEAVVSYYASR